MRISLLQKAFTNQFISFTHLCKESLGIHRFELPTIYVQKVKDQGKHDLIYNISPKKSKLMHFTPNEYSSTISYQKFLFPYSSELSTLQKHVIETHNTYDDNQKEKFCFEFKHLSKLN